MPILTITCPVDKIQTFLEERVTVEESEKEATLHNLVAHFWASFITPVTAQYPQGAPLTVLYAYVKIREALDRRSKTKVDFILLDKEHILTVYSLMQSYSQWGLELADLVAMALDSIKETLGESNE
jgi:hypothetical protein